MAVNQKIYFPNLNALRFFAAICVVIVHIEAIKVNTGREDALAIAKFQPGGLAVTCFFVLSGFLITWLLLKEKEETNGINIKKFYIRRITRIWPLYYLVLFLGFFIVPNIYYLVYGVHAAAWNQDFKKSLFTSILFLPSKFHNLPLVFYCLAPIWSIKVEEAFYLVWPVLLKKSDKYLNILIIMIFAYLTIKLLASCFFHAYSGLIDSYRIDCMAIGGIGAYIIFSNNEKILAFLYKKTLQWLVYILLVVMLIMQVQLPLIKNEFYSILFCYIIINLATNPNGVLNLDNKWMNYLGRISYGIYLFNAFTRVISLKILECLYGKVTSGWQMEILLYAFTVILTIAVAAISFKFFETPFFKIKERYEVIKTRN